MDRPPAPASRVQTEKSADQREMELGQQIRKKKKSDFSSGDTTVGGAVRVNVLIEGEKKDKKTYYAQNNSHYIQ